MTSAMVREGERIMVVCNACRYCEGYCAVFPAMERRGGRRLHASTTNDLGVEPAPQFAAGDLHFLANLCHNCGECLYACQYAPPHEFAINVPRALAQLRLESYELYAWPAGLARAFRRHSVATSIGLAAAMSAVMLGVTLVSGSVRRPETSADFYQVLPHGVMIALFGGVCAFVLVALGVGLSRCQRDVGSAGPRLDGTDPRRGTRPTYLPRLDENASRRGTRPTYSVMDASWRAIRDALTLRNLHAHGTDCTYAGEEARTPARRWLHHCTFYGFALCFASTSVAAIYHGLGFAAPYAYLSVPVVLGTAGGAGLVVGPAGLYWIGRTRDPETADPVQRPMDRGFIVLLLLTSLTGLVLLALRATAAMPLLLVVHLGVVLALFVTLPYGKFVHGLYRAAALVRDAHER